MGLTFSVYARMVTAKYLWSKSDRVYRDGQRHEQQNAVTGTALVAAGCVGGGGGVGQLHHL